MKAFSRLTVLIVLFTAVAARAEELSFKLPKDGSWVKYHVAVNLIQPKQEASGTITIGSVGQTVVDGKKCRWLELNTDFTANDRNEKATVKLLVAEAGFQKGNNPLKHLVRGWAKNGDNAVRQVGENELNGDQQLSTLISAFPAILKKEARKKSIPYQSGQLDCDTALVGTSTFKPVPNNNDFQATLHYTIWQHEKVPAGIASVKLEVTFKQKDNVVAEGAITFDVQDFGDGAKSKLPDNK